MSLALVVLHVFVCIFLVAVVLLQRGKGAEIGAVFGGGASTTVFGSRGAGNFLSRLTTLAAGIFMITSLGLAYLWADTTEDGLFTDAEAQSAPPLEAAVFEELGQAPATEPGALPALPAPGQDPAAPSDEPKP
ncbi:MAG: preprotein translocase subunit SecG [Myxococcales bacterium]|jgi:preprotein translocase subunit SecG|nr:MAG: preprotein translocase subunit SecG [Myxococcales bacterium]